MCHAYMYAWSYAPPLLAIAACLPALARSNTTHPGCLPACLPGIPFRAEAAAQSDGDDVAMGECQPEHLVADLNTQRGAGGLLQVVSQSDDWWTWLA